MPARAWRSNFAPSSSSSFDNRWASGASAANECVTVKRRVDRLDGDCPAGRRCMYEPASADVETDVLHLAFDAKEQQVSSGKFVPPHRTRRSPELRRRPRQRSAGLPPGIMHEPAAVETRWAVSPVSIWRANLVERHSRRSVSGRYSAGSPVVGRRLRGTAGSQGQHCDCQGEYPT